MFYAHLIRQTMQSFLGEKLNTIMVILRICDKIVSLMRLIINFYEIVTSSSINLTNGTKDFLNHFLYDTL